MSNQEDCHPREGGGLSEDSRLRGNDGNRRYSIFPKALGKSLEPLLKPVYKKHGFAEHRILSEWPAIVGSKLSTYSIPQKLVMPQNKKEGGTLHILVASARALELQHMQPMIIDNISTYFGYKAVAKLKFVQTGSDIFRKGAKKEKPKQHEASEALQSMVAECEDADLRAALLSLGAHVSVVEK